MAVSLLVCDPITLFEYLESFGFGNHRLQTRDDISLVYYPTGSFSFTRRVMPNPDQPVLFNVRKFNPMKYSYIIFSRNFEVSWFQNTTWVLEIMLIIYALLDIFVLQIF